MKFEKFDKLYIGFISVLVLFYSYQMLLTMNQSDIANPMLHSFSVLLTFSFLLFYLIIKINKIFNYKPIFIIVFILWIFGLFVINIFTNLFTNRTLIDLIIPLIPTLFLINFYLIFFENNWLNYYLRFIVFTTIILIMTYFTEYNLSNLYFVDDTKASLNIAYIPFLLLPTILLLNNKIIKYVLVFAIAMVVFTSMKRAGLITLFLSIITYYFINRITSKDEKLNFKTILVTIFLIFVLFVGFSTFDKINNGYFTGRFESIEDDQGSNRLDVYTEVFSLIQDSSIFNTIFGHGENAVMRSTVDEISAHNDFLEVFYDYGFFMFLLYLIIHLRLIKYLISLIKMKSHYAAAFAVSYVQFFIFSLISHIIVYPYFLLLTSFWGIVIGLNESEKRSIQELDQQIKPELLEQ